MSEQPPFPFGPPVGSSGSALPPSTQAANPFEAPSYGAEYTAEHFDDEHPLADLGQRFVGALVDGLLASALLAAGFLAGWSVAAGGSESAVVTGFAVGFLALLPLLIYQWYLLATVGQTIGKRLAGTRIVKLDGSLPGFLHAVVLRSWVVAMISNIPYVGGLFGLVNICFIFASDRRCLHDHIAGTRVIKTTAEQA